MVKVSSMRRMLAVLRADARARDRRRGLLREDGAGPLSGWLLGRGALRPARPLAPRPLALPRRHRDMRISCGRTRSRPEHQVLARRPTGPRFLRRRNNMAFILAGDGGTGGSGSTAACGRDARRWRRRSRPASRSAAGGWSRKARARTAGRWALRAASARRATARTGPTARAAPTAPTGPTRVRPTTARTAALARCRRRTEALRRRRPARRPRRWSRLRARRALGLGGGLSPSSRPPGSPSSHAESPELGLDAERAQLDVGAELRRQHHTVVAAESAAAFSRPGTGY